MTPTGTGPEEHAVRHAEHHHDLAPTTHVLELEQLAELDERLPRHHGRLGITAADLGMDAAAHPGSPLSPDDALIDLDWDGPPQFPYIHGRFRRAGHPDEVMVELHTAALRELSRRAGLRHTWGV